MHWSKDKYEYESLKSDKVLSGVFIEREYIQIRLDGQQWTHAPDFKNGKMLIGGIGGAGTSDNNIRWALEVEGTSSPLTLQAHSIHDKSLHRAP